MKKQFGNKKEYLNVEFFPRGIFDKTLPKIQFNMVTLL